MKTKSVFYAKVIDCYSRFSLLEIVCVFWQEKRKGRLSIPITAAILSMSGATELGNQQNSIFTSQSGTIWRLIVQLWITQTLSSFLPLILCHHVLRSWAGGLGQGRGVGKK